MRIWGFTRSILTGWQVTVNLMSWGIDARYLWLTNDWGFILLRRCSNTARVSFLHLVFAGRNGDPNILLFVLHVLRVLLRGELCINMRIIRAQLVVYLGWPSTSDSKSNDLLVIEIIAWIPAFENVASCVRFSSYAVDESILLGSVTVFARPCICQNVGTSDLGTFVESLIGLNTSRLRQVCRDVLSLRRQGGCTSIFLLVKITVPIRCSHFVALVLNGDAISDYSNVLGAWVLVVLVLRALKGLTSGLELICSALLACALVIFCHFTLPQGKGIFFVESARTRWCT